jgi:hypothetical protein
MSGTDELGMWALTCTNGYSAVSHGSGRHSIQPALNLRVPGWIPGRPARPSRPPVTHAQIGRTGLVALAIGKVGGELEMLNRDQPLQVFLAGSPETYHRVSLQVGNASSTSTAAGTTAVRAGAVVSEGARAARLGRAAVHPRKRWSVMRVTRGEARACGRDLTGWGAQVAVTQPTEPGLVWVDLTPASHGTAAGERHRRPDCGRARHGCRRHTRRRGQTPIAPCHRWS